MYLLRSSCLPIISKFLNPFGLCAPFGLCKAVKRRSLSYNFLGSKSVSKVFTVSDHNRKESSKGREKRAGKEEKEREKKDKKVTPKKIIISLVEYGPNIFLIQILSYSLETMNGFTFPEEHSDTRATVSSFLGFPSLINNRSPVMKTIVTPPLEPCLYL